jgi:hypothetical protein
VLLLLRSSLATLSLPYTETFTGTDGAAWPTSWTSVNNFAGVSSIQGNRGRIGVTSTADFANEVWWLNAAPIVDTDVLVTARANYAVGDGADVYSQITLNSPAGARKSGDPVRPDTGYYLQTFWQSAGGGIFLVLSRASGGTITDLGNFFYTVPASLNDYKIRVQRVGATVRAKLWLATDAEPDWQISANDSTPLGGGSVELGMMNTTASTAAYVEFDNLVISSSTPTSTGSLPVSVALTGTAVPVATSSGSVPVAAGFTGAASTVASGTGALTENVGLTGSAVTVASASGALTENAGLTGSAVTVAKTAGSLPVTAGVTGTATTVATGTGSLPANAALAGTAVPVATATGSLPIAAGLTGSAVSVAVATGSLPAAVGLTGSALTVLTATGALPVDAGITGAASTVASSTGGLPTQVGLSGTASVPGVSQAFGSLPIDTGLQGSSTTVASTTGQLAVTITMVGAAQTVGVAAGALGIDAAIVGTATSFIPAIVLTATGELPITVVLAGTVRSPDAEPLGYMKYGRQPVDGIRYRGVTYTAAHYGNHLLKPAP